MKTRTTLYDLFGLPSTATEADLHAAQRRLIAHYQSGTHGLGQDDADNKIKAVREAYWILSDPGRRAAYDASLIPTPPPSGGVASDGPRPVEVEIKALGQRSPLRIMLSIIGALMIVGMLIQIFISVFAFRQVTGGADAAMERAAAAERRQTYGTLSEQEIAEQHAAEARQRDDYRQSEAERRREQARRDEERRHEQALAERQSYANQVSADLQRAEEAARQKADWDRQQKEARERQAEAEENRRLQERLARERARWGGNN